MYDIIVVGSGPAGLTAAVYAGRASKSVLVIEKEAFGGQVTHSPKIENYPGDLEMSGMDFADRLLEQAIAQGAETEFAEVTGVEELGDRKVVHTDSGDYEAKAVIIATGVKHRRLGIDREEELEGNGVSYCAVCDGAFFEGQDVAMVGGGNSALQEAILLAGLCRKVYIVQNLPFLTGEAKLQEKIRTPTNVEVIMPAVADAILGGDSVTGFVIRNPETGETRQLDVQGIFVAIGLEPSNGAFSDVASLNSYGYFDTGEDCLTRTPGIFVAGDCRSKAVRQITTASADGAVAALSAIRYIDSL